MWLVGRYCEYIGGCGVRSRLGLLVASLVRFGMDLRNEVMASAVSSHQLEC